MLRGVAIAILGLALSSPTLASTGATVQAQAYSEFSMYGIGFGGHGGQISPTLIDVDSDGRRDLAIPPTSLQITNFEGFAGNHGGFNLYARWQHYGFGPGTFLDKTSGVYGPMRNSGILYFSYASSAPAAQANGGGGGGGRVPLAAIPLFNSSASTGLGLGGQRTLSTSAGLGTVMATWAPFSTGPQQVTVTSTGGGQQVFQYSGSVQRTPAGGLGTLSLVSPVRIAFNPAGSSPFSLAGANRFTVDLVPEPGSAAMLLAGVAALALHEAVRRGRP